MPSSSAKRTMPRLADDDRRAGKRGEIEAEVHLLVDLLALVDVGAVIGEGRLHGGVAERVEHRAAPQQLGLGLRGERRDLLVVLLAQLAVDDQELRQVVAFRLHLGRAFEDGRHDAVDQLVVDVDAAALERLREHAVVEVGARRVAGLVAREEPDRRLQILIVQQREERDAQRGIGDLDAVDRRRPSPDSRDTRRRRRPRPTSRRPAWRGRRPSRTPPWLM